MSLANLSAEDFATFKKSFHRYMNEVASSHGIEECEFDPDLPESYLSSLIDHLSAKCGRAVAVLIDEYDFPLTSLDLAGKELEKVRRFMVSFFQVLKMREQKIRFCFLTGIVRFTNLSVFSKLNNLWDLTQDKYMDAVCGYSEEEFRRCFMPLVDEHLSHHPQDKEEFLERIKAYYDGYRFSPQSETRVYNPVCVSSFFLRGCVFDHYWFGTGSMSAVYRIVDSHADCLAESPYVITQTEARVFETVELDDSSVPASYVYAFLLQSGYLTIRDIDEDGRLVLGFPNDEVADVMAARILRTKCRRPVDSAFVASVKHALRLADLDSFFSLYGQLFASLPYQTNPKGAEVVFERDFLSTLYVMGLDARGETSVAGGRADIIVRIDSSLAYVFELKVDGGLDKAERQLQGSEYCRLLDDGKSRIVAVAVDFSSATRNISSWRIVSRKG